MIALLADEDFNGVIVRGLVRRHVDILRVQDVGLRSQPDIKILEWAAENARVIVTHDMSTLIGSAYERIRAGQSMFGVIAAAQTLSVGRAIEDLELVATCSGVEDWQERVAFLPL